MRTRERGIGNLPFIAVLVLFVIALAMFFVTKDEADNLAADNQRLKDAAGELDDQVNAGQNAYDAVLKVLNFPIPELSRTQEGFPTSQVIDEKAREYLSKMAENIAKAGEIRMNSKNYQIPPGQNVIQETQGDTILIKLYQVALSKDTITVKQMLDPLPGQFEYIGKIARENNDKYETELTSSRTQISTMQTTIETNQQAYQSDLAQKQASLESAGQEKTQLQDTVSSQAAKIDNLETEIATTKQDSERASRTSAREIAALENRITLEQVKKELALAEDPKDGKVLAVSNKGTVFIDLGRVHKLSAGQKFKVWRPGKGNVREDFAVVRVFRVDRTSSEARVIEKLDPRPLTEGMSVSNPFYDPKQALTVYIYGELKSYPTDVAKRRLAASGVKIGNVLDDTIDVIVLGEPPVVATEEVVDEEEAAVQERKASMERARRLNQIMDRAKAIGAVVVTEKVLSTFIDY